MDVSAGLQMRYAEDSTFVIKFKQLCVLEFVGSFSRYT